VFNDSAPVDATYEVGVEHGIPGFTARPSDVVRAENYEWAA
jgi:hypothetical protein